MAREIKFRWWNGERMISHEHLGVLAKNLKSPEHMQYTGLKDKNGVEIYEGDVLCDNLGCPSFYQIIWNDEKAGWSYLLADSELTYVVTRQDAERCSVIGNIHENPELLESERD